MCHINIELKCRPTPEGGWAPAFELNIKGRGEMRALIMSAIDSRLTFATKKEAEAASDVTAREWCENNYPGWPVRAVPTAE